MVINVKTGERGQLIAEGETHLVVFVEVDENGCHDSVVWPLADCNLITGPEQFSDWKPRRRRNRRKE